MSRKSLDLTELDQTLDAQQKKLAMVAPERVSLAVASGRLGSREKVRALCEQSGWNKAFSLQQVAARQAVVDQLVRESRAAGTLTVEPEQQDPRALEEKVRELRTESGKLRGILRNGHIGAKRAEEISEKIAEIEEQIRALEAQIHDAAMNGDGEIQDSARREPTNSRREEGPTYHEREFQLLCQQLRQAQVTTPIRGGAEERPLYERVSRWD
jgi:polyhydroxyalkanoate synthesis regulator phasin